jgi:APA family basic amino acid/polyamine antiporter
VRTVPEARRVGLASCIALVVANMVGTGVFVSLGYQVDALRSPFLILLVWVLGGLVALCGALSYAELAAALPRSGGEYQFLAAIYHPALGFMAGFVAVMVGFAAPIALTVMTLASYLAAAVPGMPATAVATAIALGVAALHGITVRASGRFQIAVTAFKVLLIVAFVGLGVWCAPGAEFVPRPGDFAVLFSAPFAVSLMYVLYAYSGWNAAAYISGEVRRPEWTVPRALVLATVGVTVLYVALNAVFLASGPPDEFAGRREVGEIAATNLLGPVGGRIMAGLISLGLIPAISAMTWAGPRVAQAIGRDLPALGLLARTSPGGVPRPALLLQTGIVVLLLLTGTFQEILAYAFFSILSCSFLAVLGVIVLRCRQPDLPRPFRCWGYPVTPLVFLALNGFTLGHAALAQPVQSVAGLATLAAGIGLYFLAENRSIGR